MKPRTHRLDDVGLNDMAPVGFVHDNQARLLVQRAVYDWQRARRTARISTRDRDPRRPVITAPPWNVLGTAISILSTFPMKQLPLKTLLGSAVERKPAWVGLPSVRDQELGPSRRKSGSSLYLLCFPG